MRIQIVGKNIEVTKAIQNACEKKLARMDKYFNNAHADCRVVVRSYKVGAKVEVTIFTNIYTFRAEVHHEDLYAAFDLAVDKLEAQMTKMKTRMDRSKDKVGFGRAVVEAAIEKEEIDEKNLELVKTKSIFLEPMSLDQAINQMTALGHSFFIYLDKEDDKINIIYERNEGGYGAIEVENELK